MDAAPAIRPATTHDAAAVAAIYAWYVENTVITFEVDPVPAAEMARRIEAVLATHDWLVLERSSEILGFAYASRWQLENPQAT